MNQRASRIQALMATLGDPSRFRIVQLLAEQERYVLEIAEQVGLSQSCTTRHLQSLTRVGLVSRERRGKRVMFRLRTEDPAIAGLVDWALGKPAARVEERLARPRLAVPDRKAVEKRSRETVSPPVHASESESGAEPDANRYDELEDFLL